MAKKIKSEGPEFSRDREFTAVLEDLRSQFRVFGESLDDVRERVGRIEGKVEHLESDMKFVMMVLPTVATKDDLKQLERRLTALESTR